ncbi:MAG TPA: hypothetical protein VK988_03345 [Acidimicrobiales bacterium]|nr:hypothetical protein [Acidimicrobiales bacterium]
MHLHKLLQKAAEAAGYQIPKEDLDVLNAYRGLRNYYEHIDERLPGHVNAREVVRETSTEEGWRIQVGLETDHQGRVILKGQSIDVTARGLDRIEEVVRRTWDQLKPAALDGVRQHFLHDPTNIPSPSDVQHKLFVELGGPKLVTDQA